MIRNLLAFLLLSAHSLIAASPEDTAAVGVIERMVPGHADRFVVDTSAPQVDGKDSFTVSDTADGKILLRGNNGVSVASAFNWYLKNRAHCHVSWCGDQLNLPAALPKVGEPVTISTPLKYRVYLNYCTLSYTAAWWDWERWQREIDFMAMNGVNMPLSVVGLEAAWYETMLKLGFTDEQARAALSGPSFAAWQWMCNLEGHGGPLPKSWIDKSAVLGKKITESQRALGMTPIQQGFSGVVPRLTQQKFPDAKITQGHSWCGFEGVAQLDPLDPMFLKIGSILLAEQQRLFGTSHLYGCDPFHEGRPPSSKPEYLKKVGETVHKLITSHDPKGRVVMQSWSIREAIATAIPKEHMLILDLKGTKHPKTDNFWGFEFVTGRLHNFGNRIKLHGDLTRFSKAPFAHMADTIPNCVGGGLFMEGIMHNPVYFEIAFDNFWASEPMPIEAWLNDYARRRYGADSESARKAWADLLAGPYKPGTDGQETSSMVCARPAITPKKSGPNNGFSFPYPKPLLLGAWEDLLKDSDRLKSSDAYLYDLADVGRQVLSNHAHTIQPKVREAWEKRDLAAFDQATREFEQLLLDIDTLVATRSEFSFAKWVDDARSHGTTEEEKNLFEKDARGLVTIWGPFDETKGKVRIFDYSWREWSGLIRSFYLPRWQKHHAMLRSHLVAGTEYSEEGLPKEYGREAFRANDFYDKLADWEMQWVKTPAPYGDPTPKGDPVAISQKLIAKYAQQIRGEAHGIPSGAEVKEIGRWTPETFETRYKTISIPVTESIDGDGTYHVTFIYKSGRARLNITKVELLANGTLVNEDAHQGFAGNKHIKNSYELELPEHAFGTKYEIRITAKTDGSTDSNGRITIHK